MKQHFENTGAVVNLAKGIIVIRVYVENHFPDVTKMVCPPDKSQLWSWAFVAAGMLAIGAVMSGGFSLL